jgi:hypothetical protein
MCESSVQKYQDDLCYLMTPEQFDSLSCVRGFNEMNGKDYKTHMTIILESRLKYGQISEIMATETIEEALSLVKSYGINITHNHEEINF